tara:strand:+ start:3212 stop:3769 length:558 start_codon:yes stop_codon:yes gene_type:complete
MLNKSIFLSLLFFAKLGFCCDSLQVINAFNNDIKEGVMRYEQSFLKENRENIIGQIFYSQPSKLKITTEKPFKSELIVNGEFIYRTDIELNETLRYEYEKIKNQIPAMIFLTDREKACSLLREQENQGFISDFKISQKGNAQVEINYVDQFSNPSRIILSNITHKAHNKERIFEYNKSTDLVIME